MCIPAYRDTNHPKTPSKNIDIASTNILFGAHAGFLCGILALPRGFQIQKSNPQT